MAKWVCLATILLIEISGVKSAVYKVKGLECWTEWFDIDNPWEGEGDFEIIGNFVDSETKICSNRLDIQVETQSGISANSTNQNFLMYNITSGFVCLNEDQAPGELCLDYKIRFRCPITFCKQPECWTDWFDRDDGNGSGDWETLNELKNEHPGEICATPLDVEARTVKDGYTAKSTNEILRINNQGLICTIIENGQECQDYKVRFMCPIDFCFKKECWTDWLERGSAGDLVSWGVLSAIRSSSSDNFCKEILETEIKGTVNPGAAPAFPDQTVNTHVYRNEDIFYEVRFMCKTKSCPA